MGPGEVVYTKSIRVVNPMPKGSTGITSMDYKTNKGQVFALLVLGLAPDDGSGPVDANEWLKKAGWSPPGSLKPSNRSRSKPMQRPKAKPAPENVMINDASQRVSRKKRSGSSE